MKLPRRQTLALAAIVVGALVLAWLIRFGCDDAFISYNYSRALVRNEGLTWFGDHVEGYTNFSWVLWVAAGIAAGFDPLVWAWGGSLTAMAIVLVLASRIAALRGNAATVGLCTAGLLATNYTFVAYGTSGLETMLQCALLTAVAHETERMRGGVLPSGRRAASLSVVAALALWTRLDSAVVLVVFGCVMLRELVRLRAPASRYVALLAPAVMLVGGWLAWKLSYYGDILPNTFRAKVETSSATLAHGAWFVGQYLHAYLLWPMLALVVIIAIARRRFASWLPATACVVWAAYVVFVGGDFMEFRFFVPIMPLLFLVIAENLAGASELRSMALVVVAAGASLFHANRFDGDDSLDSVRKLGTFYGLVQDNEWSRLGTPLHEVLGDTGASLACNGAGAIPYYADLPTVDQLGLTDPWIAEHGLRPPPGYMRPGHQRFAPQEYLERRQVTFVIGTPNLFGRGALRGDAPPPGLANWTHDAVGFVPPRAEQMVLVGAPVNDRYQLLLWYLTPAPEITERIKAAGWEIRELGRQRRYP